MRKTWGLVGLGVATTLGITVSSSSLANDAVLLPSSLNTENRIVKVVVVAASPLKPLTEADQARLESLMEQARQEEWHLLSMGELMQEIAIQLQGTTYKAGLLDQFTQETLIAPLTKFDCVLFVEAVLSLARGVALQDYTPDTFVNQIQDLRYRDGQLNGYCSRLHYFSEWIKNNQERGNVQHIGKELDGIPLNKTINFMGNHRSSYAQLKDNDDNYNCILDMEASLEGLELEYIPQAEIAKHYDALQPGDIVGVATQIEGLDFTHTGLVYRTPEGKVGLIHASPAGEVTVAQDLQTYIGNVDKAIGIVVARPQDPRL